MADVLCPICGKPNSEHREFCDFCGNPLDGALRVEDDSGLAQNDFLDSQPAESMDDESRLDSLIPAPEEDIPSSLLDDLRDEEPLNGDSRLASLLSDEFEEPAQPDAGDKEALNGGSRLDDYLPVEEPAVSPEPEGFPEDDSSRLDDYFSQPESEEEPPLDMDSLSSEEEQEQELESSWLDDYTTPESPQDQEQESSWLDDYTTPESPQEQDQVSSWLDDYITPESPQNQEQGTGDDSRLDDFFEDDPFTSPDPFQEPSPGKEEGKDPFSLEQDRFAEPPGIDREPTPAEQKPAEELASPEDEYLSFPSLEDLSDEPETLEPPHTDDLSSPAAAKPVDWDSPEPASAQEQPGAEEPAESFDAGEWDFLDPTPTAELPGEDTPAESFDAGEWDFLESTPAEEQPGGEKPSESFDAGEWDFLDPTPAGADQGEGGPTPESAGAESDEDWSFLDPGPAADLPESEGEGEPMMEGEGEDAGWLDMLQDPESRQRLEAESEAPGEPSKPQTDWLEKIRRLNKSSDLVDEDSSFPDWLSVTGKTAEFKGQAAGDSPESSDDVPDWLQIDDDDESLDEFLRKKDLTNEEYKPKITTDSLDEADLEEDLDAPADGLSDSQQIKFPSWAEEQKRKEQQRRKAQATAGPEDVIKVPLEPFQNEEEFFDDLFSEELPSWLTAASTEDVRQSLGQNLAQAELPGWVEAMRPVVESTDASGLDDDEEYIENYGPLAGIPSVLPAEAEIGIDLDQAVQKPLDLQATKKHREYVSLIQKLIEEEDKSKTIQLPSPLQTQRVLRWLISVIMLVALAVTVIFTTSIDAGSLTPAQVQDTGIGGLYEEIETLYDGQPVLIAFDYQPAAAGELHTAAATVVDHLMEQGTYLTFVSTQPTGPALAEHFLDTTQSHHNYIHTQKYINLGYLPGESSGLLSFMIAPRQIIPLAFDGSNAWDSPPLISVDNIADFKMILVITDDPNTAKNWIEQMGSRVNKTPLTMVVSAQVEPLIQPYFRTSPRQLSGYVAGIIDSMNYERLTERPFLAHKNWLPFNIGIVISVGIILISGLANGVLSLFSRRKEKLRGESK